MTTDRSDKRMCANINGRREAAPHGAVAWKYADPTEDARWIYDEQEARDIARIDPSLIVRVELAVIE